MFAKIIQSTPTISRRLTSELNQTLLFLPPDIRRREQFFRSRFGNRTVFSVVLDHFLFCIALLVGLFFGFSYTNWAIIILCSLALLGVFAYWYSQWWIRLKRIQFQKNIEDWLLQLDPDLYWDLAGDHLEMKMIQATMAEVSPHLHNTLFLGRVTTGRERRGG